jgi:hypothetical protein
MVKANSLPIIDNDRQLTIEYYEQDLLDADKNYPPSHVKEMLHANMVVKVSIGDESKYQLEGYELFKEDEWGGLTFVGKLVEALQSVRFNHAASIHEDICLECKDVWPCKTIQDIELVLDQGFWQEGYQEPTSVVAEEIDYHDYHAKIADTHNEYIARFGRLYS